MRGEYLSSHSLYFATLFLEKFQELEIELKHVDPHDFQYYLEVLYLENGIDDDTVDGILSVANIFDAPIIVRKYQKKIFVTRGPKGNGPENFVVFD
ncbi:unnamed protein product [Caenorhabditis nigoni]